MGMVSLSSGHNCAWADLEIQEGTFNHNPLTYGSAPVWRRSWFVRFEKSASDYPAILTRTWTSGLYKYVYTCEILITHHSFLMKMALSSM